VIQPGRFNPIGTLIGVYFLASGIIGLQLMGVGGWIVDVFYGLALVIAVSVSTLVSRRRKRS
jgi:ribose transport system permease protein